MDTNEVVLTREGLEKLRSVTPFHYNVPLMVLVCYDMREVWTNPSDRFYRNSTQANRLLPSQQPQ